ncbi:MAG: hypothetical protein M3130_01160 [Actinomycetota bacterium]|nr:hypothetical protein [Actinomycetota bacterium]
MVSQSRRFELRIEKLAATLLRNKWDRFEGGPGAWQMALMQLQRDIQKAISTNNSGPRRSRDRELAETLKSLRWHARHLGDTLAWLVLRLDRQRIETLGENDPVPIAQRSRDSEALLALVDNLASRGWGFPLLHDVTDCLRIGDVTFVRVDDVGDPYTTLEVKSHMVSATPTGDGETEELEYQVSLIGAREFDPDTGRHVAVSPAELKVTTPRTRADRQALRMHQSALKMNSASTGLVTGLPQPSIAVHLETDASSDWRMVRRLIRQAHREGCSGEAADDTFFYAAIYQRGGLTPEGVKAFGQLESLKRWSAKEPESQGQRVIQMWDVPTQRARFASPGLPFWLFDIPFSARLEILRGELLFMCMTDLSRLCDALNADGHDVELRPQGNRAPQMLIRDRWTVGDRAFYINGAPIGTAIYKAALEFHSAEYVLATARQMIVAARQAAPVLHSAKR